MKDLKFNDDVLMVKNCDHADLKDISDDINNLKEENARLNKRIRELEHFTVYCSSFSGCESSKNCMELHSITTWATELLEGK